MLRICLYLLSCFLWLSPSKSLQTTHNEQPGSCHSSPFSILSSDQLCHLNRYSGPGRMERLLQEVSCEHPTPSRLSSLSLEVFLPSLALFCSGSCRPPHLASITLCAPAMPHHVQAALLALFSVLPVNILPPTPTPPVRLLSQLCLPFPCLSPAPVTDLPAPLAALAEY